jgi:hypothetical protein
MMTRQTYAHRLLLAKIPRMSNRLIGISSRCILFVCGAVTVLMGNLHRSLLFLKPLVPGNSTPVSWYLFPVALMVVGGSVMVIALLPTSWVAEKSTRPNRIALAFTSVPVKMFGAFALFSYLLTVGLDLLAPVSWHPSPTLVFSLCPACVLTITVDPSLVSVLLILAPLDGAVYGSFGALVGFVLVILRRLSPAPGS